MRRTGQCRQREKTHVSTAPERALEVDAEESSSRLLPIRCVVRVQEGCASQLLARPSLGTTAIPRAGSARTLASVVATC